ncbi:MAG: hypothetical protein ICV77_17410 [Cyanobacteria bacterium Co-bin8]|nr:hypothetical protein [Cyanobacteria bacterium Co-bin8]
MGLLTPARIVQDEGVVDAARFFWNVLTQPRIRQRLLPIRRMFTQYKQDLGYILQLAERQD